MNFYEKTLSELTDEEWEKICMRCGKCCMCKYSEDGVIHLSNHVCRFFDVEKGLCSCYDERFDVAGSECRKVSMELLEHNLDMLPPSCAYRRLYEGRGLPEYHPLLTGDEKSAEKAGQTVKSMPVVSEKAKSDAIAALVGKASVNHWSKAVIRRKVVKICQKFSLKWLETYPSL